MGKYKRNYLRREEKDEIMSLACLTSVTQKLIDRYVEFRKDEKVIIKNLRSSVTFSKKALEEIFGSLELKVLEDIKNFVETKELIIADPSDAKLYRSRAEKTENEIHVDTNDFVSLCEQIKKDVCDHCDGSCYDDENECPYKKIMLIHSAVDGSGSYDRCPFIGEK